MQLVSLTPWSCFASSTVGCYVAKCGLLILEGGGGGGDIFAHGTPEHGSGRADSGRKKIFSLVDRKL